MKENGKEYYDEIVKKKICYEKKRKAKWNKGINKTSVK
jgi:hypothetical protein